MDNTNDKVNNSIALVDKVQKAITYTTGDPFERIRRYVKDLYWPDRDQSKQLGARPVGVGPDSQTCAQHQFLDKLSSSKQIANECLRYS